MLCPPLHSTEAEEIRRDPACRERLLRSYKMMLNFYGMDLLDERTGEIRRSAHWKCTYTTISIFLTRSEGRYEHLSRSPHNYLRITRILKALGDLGFEHYQKPWLLFFIREIYEENNLLSTQHSLVNFWLQTIKDDKEREEIEQKIINYISSK